MTETEKGFIQLHTSVLLAGFTGLFGRLDLRDRNIDPIHKGRITKLYYYSSFARCAGYYFYSIGIRRSLLCAL